jgi:hypothetical protein
LADDTSGSHGESLTRLIASENQAKEAHRLSTSFGPYFVSTYSPTLPPDTGTAIVELTKTHLTLVSEKRTTAQKDNDLIYNAILPSEASLPPIDKLAVATPIPIQEVYGTPEVQKVIGPDIFIKLVPLSVHESASVYSEEKAKLVRGEVERSDSADSDLRVALDSLGLPKGLRKWKELASPDSLGSNVPKQVDMWAEEVRRGNAVAGIEKLFGELEKLKGEVGAGLDAVSRDLDVETRDCEAMRVSQTTSPANLSLCSSNSLHTGQIPTPLDSGALREPHPLPSTRSQSPHLRVPSSIFIGLSSNNSVGNHETRCITFTFRTRLP